MAKKDNIPAKVRDVYVTKTAYDLLNKQNITTLPVDPFAIIKSFGWIAYTVEEAESYGVKCPFNLNADKPAVSMKVNDDCNYLIVYYDEKYLPRLRWTIAHEIGHIVLGHTDKFPYSLAEIEAHKFAAELLAPTRIIVSDMFPRTISRIAELCDISLEAAEKEFQMFTGSRQITVNAIMTREGEQLYRNMYGYLLETSNYWQGRLTEKDITLPTQYEDYIYCNYWEYVKNKMKISDKPLYALLDNSVAFYDNKDMVLFVTNAAAVNIDSSQKNTIIEKFTKFTNSPIRNIVSVQVVA